ncbi:MAG TPA: 3-deoxy-manno-octulosonate cytidylyltransferase [Thermoanaerobaculia bacterium]|nr:3-deoxy-manno-octulosonate cytidylyltransferase [Thermoanaerobaculia bacterium]
MPHAPEVFGAIPARYGSTRLPGKPLARIAGKPMIQHVYERTAQAEGLARVVVLTDDERIVSAVRGFGGEAEMTPETCTSGTDRIAWAARSWRASAVVNIQGDEPMIDPDAVSQIAAHLAAHPEDPIVTVAVAAEAHEFDDPNAVKVVLDRFFRALYFSRSRIPHPRGEGSWTMLKHLGIYGYQRAALLELAALDPTPLERTESLEQLRALENGIPIRVLRAARTSIGVDTAEDLARVERFLAAPRGD